MFDINFNYTETVIPLLHLAIACLLALPIAWNREKATRSAGLRTFPLAAVATCAFMLTGRDIYTGDDARARVLPVYCAGKQ